jgi:hypothetical protein
LTTIKEYKKFTLGKQGKILLPTVKNELQEVIEWEWWNAKRYDQKRD